MRSDVPRHAKAASQGQGRTETEMTPPVATGDSPAAQAEPTSPTRYSTLNWLGWAVFLAVSWTWCIGMFLPVLLVRDYGLWGWIVFAVPNMIGAAAMGWVMHRVKD